MLHIKDRYAAGIQTVVVMRQYRSGVTGSSKTLGIYSDLTGGKSDGVIVLGTWDKVIKQTKTQALIELTVYWGKYQQCAY